MSGRRSFIAQLKIIIIIKLYTYTCFKNGVNILLYYYYCTSELIMWKLRWCRGRSHLRHCSEQE